MFVYRPPKSSCWGNALRPRDTDLAKQKLDVFLAKYFEKVEQRNAMFSTLRWKHSELPNVAWPEEYLRPENKKWQEVEFGYTGERVMFPLGLIIPVSPLDLSSYQFIRKFGGCAPFKMSPKHFSVVVRVGKKDTLADRKPDSKVVSLLDRALSRTD